MKSPETELGFEEKGGGGILWLILLLTVLVGEQNIRRLGVDQLKH